MNILVMRYTCICVFIVLKLLQYNNSISCYKPFTPFLFVHTAQSSMYLEG